MKNNRQIGLDGRIFLSDCLSDGIFFIYSIILSGFLGAAGDIMKLLGESSRSLTPLTNSLMLCDLVCSLGMIMVTYYVYFMHCGENIPKLDTKPLIWLEYLRLGYYGVLAYEVLYRLISECLPGSGVPVAIPIFYFFYFIWLVCCMCAAMFILTVLHQNMIRRSYSQSFRFLALVGLGVNVVLPLVYFITRIWVKGGGDGFYSAGLCDFVRFALAPIFYAAVWFLFMSAIDQVDRVFNEVDNAIRDKNYRIEFEEDEGTGKKKLGGKKKSGSKNGKSGKSGKKKSVDKKKSDKKNDRKPSAAEQQPVLPVVEPEETQIAPEIPQPEEEELPPVQEPADEAPVADSGDGIGDSMMEDIFAAPTVDVEPAAAASEPEPEEEFDEKGAKRVKPKKKHRITQVEEDSSKVKASAMNVEDLAAEIFEKLDAADASDSSETEENQ